MKALDQAIGLMADLSRFRPTRPRRLGTPRQKLEVVSWDEIHESVETVKSIITTMYDHAKDQPNNDIQKLDEFYRGAWDLTEQLIGYLAVLQVAQFGNSDAVATERHMREIEEADTP